MISDINAVRMVPSHRHNANPTSYGVAPTADTCPKPEIEQIQNRLITSQHYGLLIV